MEFERASLATCGTASGIVVAIDVLRAFSTAAYAFGAGAQSILLTGSVEEALALKQRFPHALLMGEVNGLPIPGFDFGNSPTLIARQDLHARQLIQRTSAGTQGIVRSHNAGLLFASSLCCDGATAKWIKRHAAQHTCLTFVITGQRPPAWGDEDAACADYIEALLKGQQPDTAAIIQRVRSSPAGQVFMNEDEPDFPASDLEHCLAIDRFDFDMQVGKEDGLMVMRPIVP